jgi:glyoxylase-like metal-dependent hydrolase (beta-lactamase superfamily II)
MHFSPSTVQLTTGGKALRLHLLSTGAVAVKTKFREAMGKGLSSTLRFILDRKFTEWLPVWVLVIEHPEGIFLVDTGELAAVNDPAYFKSSGILANWFDTTQFKFEVDREEEVDRQLLAFGIGTKDIRAIILTHLHFDHTDGLRHFPDARFLVARSEWERPFGDLPALYPPHFRPDLLDLDCSWGAFERVAFLTEAKDLALVHTPGHTHGHCSVLLRTDTCHILFAADVCYSEQQLLQEKFSANSASLPAARKTYASIKAFARQYPLVFLPSHDAGSGIRLQQLATLPGI